MLALDDLTTPITGAEAKTSIYRVLAAVGVTTTNWKPGAVVRTIIAGVAIVLAAFSRLTAGLARSGFVGLARGDWLTLAARYDRGVERELETFAAGTVVLVNAGGGVFSGTAEGDLELEASATGQRYISTGAWSLAALGTSAPIAVRAVLAGSAGTALAGEIDTIITGGMGLVSVTNADALIGLDDESDESLLARCDAKLGALSPNGPADAYRAVALSAVRADGTGLGVTRVRHVRDGVGGIDLYAATASGGVSGTVGDTSTDLGALDDQLQRQATPLAVTLRTHTAAPVSMPVTYEAWLYANSGLTEAQIAARFAAALADFVPRQPIGGNVLGVDPGKIYVSAIVAALGAATVSTAEGSPRLPLLRVVVTAPAADLALGIGQVATLGTVTATAIHQEPPP